MKTKRKLHATATYLAWGETISLGAAVLLRVRDEPATLATLRREFAARGRQVARMMLLGSCAARGRDEPPLLVPEDAKHREDDPPEGAILVLTRAGRRAVEALSDVLACGQVAEHAEKEAR